MTDNLIGLDDLILITGASGFIGIKVVERLLDMGFRRLRCFVRVSSNLSRIDELALLHPGSSVEIVSGSLLSQEDCKAAAENVALVFHLAAGTGTTSFPDAYLNSVVTTGNLLDASIHHESLRRFVNISSFAVYSNTGKPRWRKLDESCPVERHPELRDAYCFAKVKQEEIVTDYAARFGLPYVILRPGHVYGPDRDGLTARIGIDTFGTFLHLGGANRLPATYVDNCAEAIVMAGLTKGVDREVFNIVDDELPTSRTFLKHYKRNVRTFSSLYLPHAMSYVICSLWERYSVWSEGKPGRSLTRKRWHALWKRTNYSNAKLRRMVGWEPRVSLAEGLQRHFESLRGKEQGA